MDAELLTVDGKPVLRLERRLAHPPAKVWRAITSPDELRHWFPASVSIDGTRMRFTMGDEPVTEGVLLTFDEPRVFAFRWQNDILRFELEPADDGCLLVFTHVLGDGGLSAGRSATGWDVCLDALVAQLSGAPFEEPTEWLEPIERYVEKFGLGAGVITPEGLRFERDLMWKSLDELWALLIEDSTPVVGGEPPVRATNPHMPAGVLTVVDGPRVLSYSSPHGQVRFEFAHDPMSGSSVTLTQSVSDRDSLPLLLAAWHVHLELFFAATFDVIRCPWPADRVAELRARYAVEADAAD